MTTVTPNQSLLQTQPHATPLVPAGAAAESGSAFGAVLDAINPLQHIPIVSNLFRASQGTEISPVAQLAGDTLYGGLIGGAISSFISSLADVAVKGVTGQSISEHVVATVSGSDTASETKTPAANALIATSETDVAVATKKKEEIAAEAEAAAHFILRNDVHPEQVAAQYQRAQTLDIANKLLITAGS